MADNAKIQDWNVCKNWGLRCFEQKVTDKSVTLKCAINRKREDGTYTKPVYIDVICVLGKCDIAEDDYAKSYINVDGYFSVDSFTTKNGEEVPTMKIFATKVTKAQK